MPSSVHEVIVLASENGMKYKDLASIVRGGGQCQGSKRGGVFI